MGVNSRAVDITDDASPIYARTSAPQAEGIAVHNTSEDAIVYLGGADVTSANGFPLGPGQALGLDPGKSDELYGRCADGETAEVRLLEVAV